MNAKMPALKACFEAAGFSEVRALRQLRTVVWLQCLARVLKLLQRLAPREVAKSKVFTVLIPA